MVNGKMNSIFTLAKGITKILREKKKIEKMREADINGIKVVK